MRWPLAKLEDVALPSKGSIVSGPFGSNIGSRFFVDEGIPVIRGSNLTFGDRAFIDDGFVFLTEDKAAEFKNCEAIAGDLIFTAAGTIGQVGIIPAETRFDRYIISNKQLRVRCDQAKVYPHFLFLWFTTGYMRQHIINQNRGCSIPLINLGVLRQLPVPLPPMDEQKRIAATVSTYDGLIENNRWRMGLLEEEARQLYREWFVRLRFPGHERVKIKDGLPEGWERVPTPVAIEINPGTRLSDDEEHWWVEMSDLPTDSMVIQNYTRREGRTGSKFQNGDTLFARITPCLENGKTGFVNFMEAGEVGRGSTEFIVLREKRLPPEFVYCLARTYAFRENAIKSMVGSSGRQRVQESCFEKFLVLVPPRTVLDLFTESVRPMFSQIRILHLQNQKLRAARDLLLPKLMSGEIAV
jgi:type I restriction enzyme S subunit